MVTNAKPGDDRAGSAVAARAHLGASWRDADTALRRIAKRRAGLDTEELEWLVEARRVELHRHLGMGSLREYLERILGYGPRTASERIRVAEALCELPDIAGALATGEISFSAAREITRVATPETERAWLQTAMGRTLREVEEDVAGHVPGDLPGSPRRPELARRVLRMEVAPATLALYRETKQRLQRETGGVMTDDEVLAMLCRGALGGGVSSAPAHQVAVTTCSDCKRGWQDGAGTVVELPGAAIERARCDATEIGRIDGPLPERAVQTVPPAVRRMVIQRDHGRCRVPGCRASMFCDLHHIVPRSQAGDSRPENLILLCNTHHDAVHDGRLAIRGRAPDGLVFEHADGRPYGSQPSVIELARTALRKSGFSAADARAAVEAARVHVGEDPPLERLIFESFRAMNGGGPGG